MVVAFGADAAVADAAGDVVVEEAVGDLPGGVLQVGEGVQIHDGGAEGGGEVDGSGVVAEEEGGGLQEGDQVPTREMEGACIC